MDLSAIPPTTTQDVENNSPSYLISAASIRYREVRHYRSLPYVEVPSFIKTLRASRAKPVTKLAFEWPILTATRSGETRGAM